MIYNDDRFHSRKSPRIPHYDYTSANYYFVTICTRNRECIFGLPDKNNSRRKIAEQGITEIGKHFSDVMVDKFVVMPNHIHIIIVLNGSGSNLSTVIGLYKSYVTRMIRKTEPNKQIWQSSFHDHVIRNQSAYEKIWLYIESNPDNWEKDCFFEALNNR